MPLHRHLLRSLVLLLVLAAISRADRMVIPPAGVFLSEPGQKAVVAANGSEEILILATDLQASKPTKVLQALPLPGRPEVSLGSAELLDNLKSLLERHGKGAESSTRGSGGGEIKLLSHRKLGPHELVVLELQGAKQLNNLLLKHLGEELSPAAVDIVESYVKSGCHFLVVDLVEVGPETGSVPPVVYRFPCRELFYPLRTSNLVGGKGNVDLFLLTPPATAKSPEIFNQRPFPFVEYWDDFSDARPEDQVPRDSTYFARAQNLSRADVDSIDPALKGFFPDGAMFILHHYEGPLRFPHDLRLPESLFKEHAP